MHSSARALSALFAYIIFPLLDGFLTYWVPRRVFLVGKIVKDSAVGDGFISRKRYTQLLEEMAAEP